MEILGKNSKYSTGVQREAFKRDGRFKAKDLAKLFDIKLDGAYKKIKRNSFSAEEAISLIFTYYKYEEINIELFIDLFTYSTESFLKVE